MNNKNLYTKMGWLFLPLLLLFSNMGCRKFVETHPPSNVVTESTVYNSDATAISVLTAIYSAMNTSPFQGSNGNISLYTSLSADEYSITVVNTNPIFRAYYSNSLTQVSSPNVSGGELWAPLYNLVFKCNAAIEGLDKSTGLTSSIKERLLGEAHFLRGFFYFYLVNMFGDLPLVLTTDYKVNTLLSRSSRASIYQQIITDLKDAQGSLSEVFLAVDLLNSTTERVRPTKWAVTALLARVYLYIGEYDKAEIEASKIINNSSLFSLPALNNVFLKNSKEAIWQIQPTAIDQNTQEGKTLIIPPTGPNVNNNPVFLGKVWLNNFESNDRRKVFTL